MGLNVIMMGPPGAGKGTQAGRIARERGLLKISTGDILRDAVRDGQAEALLAKATMDRGELVEDATMIAIVRQRLTRPDAQVGVVLDGFPRTVAQARALDAIISERGTCRLVVLDMMVPEQELVRRLASRRICSSCGTNAEPSSPDVACRTCSGELVQRADDNQSVVIERLKVYQQSTRQVLEYYRQRPTFRAINAAQSPDVVGLELDAMIDEVAGLSDEVLAPQGKP